MAKSVICDLLQTFKSSVSAVLPENLIRKSLKYNPVNQQLTICGDNYNIKDKNVYLVGTGKAVRNMAIEVENILSSKIKKGILSVPEGSIKVESKVVSYYQGATNNLPDKNAENTTKKVNNLVSGLGSEDLLLVLISGGGSALLSLPKPPVTLEEKTYLIKMLANSGADIKELNTVRKRLSDIKGGMLAIKAQPAKVVSLILSDIVGDPIDLIASGPTVNDEDDSSKAIDVINKYNLFNDLPSSIKDVLKENNKSIPFPNENVKNYVIGSNKLSIQAAEDKGRQLNYTALQISNAVTGNVVDIAEEYAKLTKTFCKFLNGTIDSKALKSELQTLRIPGLNIDQNEDTKGKDLCLILGGEITVEVKGSGKGGRNQQLALEFSRNIHNLKDEVKEFNIYFLSAGTDGIDGPTDAAGAITYLNLLSDAKKENIDIDKFIDNNDSYNFFKEFQNGNLHVITGHTNTNVMDIHLIVIKRNK